MDYIKQISSNSFDKLSNFISALEFILSFKKPEDYIKNICDEIIDNIGHLKNSSNCIVITNDNFLAIIDVFLTHIDSSQNYNDVKEIITDESGYTYLKKSINNNYNNIRSIISYYDVVKKFDHTYKKSIIAFARERSLCSDYLDYNDFSLLSKDMYSVLKLNDPVYVCNRINNSKVVGFLYQNDIQIENKQYVVCNKMVKKGIPCYSFGVFQIKSKSFCKDIFTVDSEWVDGISYLEFYNNKNFWFYELTGISICSPSKLESYPIGGKFSSVLEHGVHQYSQKEIIDFIDPKNLEKISDDDLLELTSEFLSCVKNKNENSYNCSRFLIDRLNASGIDKNRINEIISDLDKFQIDLSSGKNRLAFVGNISDHKSNYIKDLFGFSEWEYYKIKNVSEVLNQKFDCYVAESDMLGFLFSKNPKMIISFGDIKEDKDKDKNYSIDKLSDDILGDYYVWEKK